MTRARLHVTPPRRGDLVAGVTVALVLVPQAIAYAALADLPPQVGLYAAAAAPVFAAAVGSSPYLQTGPVALTSLLVLGALAPFSSSDTAEYVALAALLALLVGAVRFLVGVTRTGVVAYLMSQPVVAAFTLAAAVMIVGSQVPALLGVPPESDNPVVRAAAALTDPGAWQPASLVIGAVVGALVLVGRRVDPLLPAALVGSVLAALAVHLWSLDAAVVGSLPSGLPAPQLDLPWSAVPQLLVPAVVIAFVGFAEPASIARQYAGVDRSPWDPDREFVGQGLANLGSGLFGGYPVGGSFSRSALNRLSGARTRWSGAVTGLCVAAVLPVADVLAGLPTAALAGLVVVSVLPLLNPRPVFRTWRMSRAQFAVAMVTLAVSLLAAPQVQWGVVAGVAVSLAVHLWRELRLDVEIWRRGSTLHVRPQGVLYFGSAPRLETRIISEIADRPQVSRVRLELQRLGRIDLTGALVLRAICRDLGRGDVQVSISGVQPQWQQLVESVFADEPVDYTRSTRERDDEHDRE
ncbi:SulP family inorganic anion transporter [Nocardioides sp. GCM10027113]|uniref:SulP family inorganic anion transporter n=1 Tax=unclassified Nocardioides TaxID=2615069 RepID=UPI00360B514A